MNNLQALQDIKDIRGQQELSIKSKDFRSGAFVPFLYNYVVS